MGNFNSGQLLNKINVKSVSLLIACLLIISGIAMSLKRISEHGAIDLKSSIISGKIQTGSLGLMVIFLGVFIVISVIFHSGVFLHKKGEKIEIELDNKRVICENISFRKVQEIREILKNDKNSSNDKHKT